MGGDIGDFSFLVSGNAFVLVMPLGEQEPNGSFHELWKIAKDETSVLTGKFDLPGEAQIITHKHTGTSYDARGEGLIVAIAEAEHPAVVFAGLTAMDLHQAEVALAIVGQRMSLGADEQVGGGEGFPNGGDQLSVERGVFTARTSSRSTD